RAGGERLVEPIVHEQRPAAGRGDLGDPPGKRHELARREILLAELDHRGPRWQRRERACEHVREVPAPRGLAIGDEIEEGRARHGGAHRLYSMSPTSGDEAFAYARLGIRPARNALRPAETASRMAS